MKKIYSSLVLFLLVASSIAQTPMHYNANNAAGNNSFPLNTTTSRKVQWRINANSLVNPSPVGPGNDIVKVYFQTGNTTVGNYPLLNVSLKQGPAQFAGTGSYETGMTNVYTGVNIQVTPTIGGWISFTLATPFNYNPALPLFVELEHNATSGGGPTLYQNSPAGPGFGRLYGNYPNANYNGADQTVVNFGVDVIPSVPCSGTPGANTVVTPTNAICPNSSAVLGLATTYSVGGINYQWQYSNVSAVGPWTNVPNGTSPFLTTPSLSTVHYFNTIITCTNSNGSVTATAGTLNIAATTTNNVPYYESFEGIGEPNKLPNCSWNMSHPGTTCLTYTSVQNQNRSARTGQSYASFYFTPSQSNFFWTNGIWMEAGVTYSASTWYKTEYNTNPTWQLMMWTSPVQTTANAGASIIATSGGPGSAAAPSYVPFSNTFVVTSSGYYHVGINAISSGGTGYLTWDDLAIELPCDLNPVPLSINSSTQTICSGLSINLTAIGADSYVWNTGATSPAIFVTPFISTNYTVTGTVALTGCSKTESIQINVLNSPAVNAVSTQSAICAGSSANLVVIGDAISYQWNNAATGSNIFVSPAVTTAYTVTGTGANGCTASSTINVVVNPLPSVSASGDNSGIVCEEDVTIMSANGAITYQWASSSTLLLGNPVYVSPNVSTIYTVTGTDQFGCMNTATVQLAVTNCVGLKESSASASDLHVYPNPSTGIFTLENTVRGEKTIEVSDVSGRKVYELQTNDEEVQMNLNQLSNGVYYIKLTVNEKSTVVKIVKE